MAAAKRKGDPELSEPGLSLPSAIYDSRAICTCESLTSGQMEPELIRLLGASETSTWLSAERGLSHCHLSDREGLAGHSSCWIPHPKNFFMFKILQFWGKRFSLGSNQSWEADVGSYLRCHLAFRRTFPLGLCVCCEFLRSPKPACSSNKARGKQVWSAVRHLN